MGEGDYYQTDTGPGGIADGESLTIGLDESVPAILLQTYVGAAAADVYYETDPDGDGTYEISVLADSFPGSFYVEDVGTFIHRDRGNRIRIENTSGGVAHYAANGTETTSRINHA